MSETDDTDDLLLIPPDFFLVGPELESKNSFGPFYGIIDNLVTEVILLQDRISTIESISDISLVGSTIDTSENSTRMTEFRKYNSTDDLYFTHSNQSTPHKNVPKPKVHSLPSSPNVKRISPHKILNRKSPRKKLIHKTGDCDVDAGGEVLSDIDNFLSKVKTIQKFNAVRNLEKQFDSNAVLLEDFDNKELRKHDTGDNKQIHSKSNTDKVSPVKEPHFIKEQTWRCGNNSNDNSFEVPGRDQYLQSKPKHISRHSPDTSSSSESTQATAFFNSKTKDDLLNNQLHSNAMNILNLHKELEDSVEETIQYKKKDKIASQNRYYPPQNHLELISLANIWDKSSQDTTESTYKHKLHEEKLRRQHCEVLISELHQRNLELQQKLAVAIKVDQAKDNAIGQLKELTQNVSKKLDNLAKEKLELEKETQNIKYSNLAQLEESKKKADFYEKEAAKALNIADRHRDKLGALEDKCSELTNVLTNLEKTVENLKEQYAKESHKNKQLSDCLGMKEIELLEYKNLLNSARSEVSESKGTIDICQSELNEMKKECDRLENLLKNERKQLVNAQEQQRNLVEQLDKKNKSEKQLKEEINMCKDKLDSTKIELRNFYQGQVELLVQNKLKEFQSQLDKAEQVYKEEIKNRENQIARNAATHLQQLSEKCSLEIKLLEQKHQEEIKLYQIQIFQHKEEIESMKSKLETMTAKKNQQVQQLQKIIENQWNEALKIITSGKSPTPTDQFDQLNSLKARSYNNLEELLSYDNTTDNVKPTNHEVGVSNTSLQETPVSSRMPPADSNLQKLMNMLMTKPSEAQNKRNDKVNSGEPSAVDKTTWPHLVRSRKPT